MNELLILNEGTVLNGYCILDGANLFVYLYESTMEQAYPILSDRQKTCIIRAEQYGETAYYEGYDHLYCISEEIGGMVSAILKRGAD